MQEGPAGQGINWDLLASATEGGLQVEPTFRLPLPQAHQAVGADGELDRKQLEAYTHCSKLLGACLGHVSAMKRKETTDAITNFVDGRSSKQAKVVADAGHATPVPPMVTRVLCQFLTTVRSRARSQALVPR